jgi:molybdenum cofactor cytidylyltransferase
LEPVTAPPPRFALGVILLAAGASTRMGQPKMLLPWGQTTVIGHLLAQWRRLPAEQIAVVRSPENHDLWAELNRLSFSEADGIVNAAPEAGMFSSIQCAARWPGWKPDISHWVIVLGDQPHLRFSTLNGLIQFAIANPNNVCQPFYDHRPRHPVLLPRPVFERLRSTRETTLKNFLQNSPDGLKLCGIEDPGLAFDMDRPEDYQRAVQLYFKAT